MRRFVSLVLLICMLCQSMVTASMPSAVDAEASYESNAQHMSMHLDGIAHHHHDGGFHEDDSQESVMHVLADLGLQTSAILPSGLSAVLRPSGLAPVILTMDHRPPPDLDGLKRPPRSHA